MKFMAQESLNVNLEGDQHCCEVTFERAHLLDHIQDCLVLVQPHVVIWYCHRLEGDGFGVFEKRVRSPHVFEPVYLQQSVL